MIVNSIIEIILNRKSIRRYREELPSDEIIGTIVRAGQQAPFATQAYSLLISRKQARNPFRAPLLFTICVDLHKLELTLRRRGWRLNTNDLALLLFVTQDACLAAENMVIAAESLGLGSCFIGGTFYSVERIVRDYQLPERVFPILQLVMGYPAESPKPRPRYPSEFVLFENRYPELEEIVDKALNEMDAGFAAQDYYRTENIGIIPLENRKETFTFDNYVWSEHIARKWGQWHPSPRDVLEPLNKCGFHITELDCEDHTE